MRETNHAVYYTTAQVKDMVELSDQNVRKYVRMLEERKYEVAKDEHNRRLFSQEDIAVLKEFIKLAKQPGYTLETAADEIIEKVPHIVYEKGENAPASVTNNDINRMIGAVMDKLETMQQENRELKHNVNHLVERLEAYSKYNEPLSLEYRSSSDGEQFPDWEDAEVSTELGESRSMGEMPEEKNPVQEEAEEVAQEETESEDIPDEAPDMAADSKNSNIDMSSYANDEGQNNRENNDREEGTAAGKEEEKGGYFSKLFSIFKK
ncbi:MerR family transcriptional regulator [Salinicoccus carnicancri]|uniref:MerR family transcriptional regulator n=1 Tax=Salinicoccus carnicancri TaxID=558170 RepID=UPI0003118408|nr:MerR family transcriptional regulator [Salinicoccus carnicancri]